MGRTPPRSPHAAPRLLALAAIALASGCGALLGIHDVERDSAAAGGGAGGGGGGGGAGGGTQAEFTVSLTPTTPRVVRGSSVDLTVTVTREAGFDGAIELSLVDLPSGVTAGTTIVPAAESTGLLTLTADLQAALGPAAASVQATSEGLDDRTVPVTVLVADPPGTLDQTFDGDGIATTDATGMAQAIAVQPDDKIVVAGVNGTTWVIARYLPGGELDPDFGTGGVVLDIDGTVNDIALQPDGRILVAGHSNDQAVIARYNTDGARDQAFAANGLAALDGSIFSSSRGFGVAVQSTGAIVLAGTATPANEGFLLRFSPSGQRDPGFPSSGGGSVADQAYHGVVIGADDSILVGGTASSPAGPTFMAARFDKDGAADASFGGTGSALLGPTPFNDSGLALQDDGQPVLSGSRLDGANGLAFGRFAIDGAPDATFGMNGLVNEENNIYERAHDLALSVDQKLLSVTTSGTPASGLVAAIVRRLPDGSPDTGFGTSGQVLIDSGAVPSYLYAVAVQRDGRIVAAGRRDSATLMVVRVWD